MSPGCGQGTISLFLVFIVGHLLTAASNKEILRWQKINAQGLLPKPRKDGAIGFDTTRNSIVIFGGRSDTETFSDTWALDILNKTWARVNDSVDGTGLLVPGPKYGMVFGTDNNTLVVAFGRNGGATSTTQAFYTYDFSLKRWNSTETLSGSSPSKRFQTTGSMIKDYMYTSHGKGDSDLQSDSYRLNLKSKGWEKIHDKVNQYNPVLPHARYAHGLISLANNELLLYGGCLSGKKSAGPCPSNDAWLYSINRRRWSKIIDCPSARIFPGMSLLPNSTESLSIAVLFGGKQTGSNVIKSDVVNQNEVLIFDSEKNEWSHRAVLKDPTHGFPKLRYSHAMTAVRDGIAIFGGASTSNDKLLNDVWVLKGDVSAARRSTIPRTSKGSNVNMLMLHGIFMFFAWAVFVQLGVFVSRYMRHKEGWLTVHKTLMIIGLTLAIVGFGLGIASFKGTHFSFVHGAIGLDIMLAGLYQPLNAAFRPTPPNDGEKPRLWRRIWEISHRFTGIVAVLLSLINISLGLFLSVAGEALWISWFSYLALIMAAFIIAEIRLRLKNSKPAINVAGHNNELVIT